MKKIFALILILAGYVLLQGCAVPPLRSAAHSGDINAVKDLLNKGADVNEKNIALMWAADKGHTEVVKLLIDKGADVNFRENAALDSAADSGHTDTAKLLIEKGAKVGSRALVSAAYMGRTDTVKLLVEKGADADIDMALAQLERFDDRESKVGVKLIERFKPKQKVASEPQPFPVIKSDVDEIPAIKAKPNKNSYAIVIGIENYRQKLPKADYALADARTMTEYLTKVMGYPEENVVTLTNEHAAKSDFGKYFEKWLPNNVEKDSSVFIYYSGHGAPNTKTGDAYLVPYDGDPSFIDETGYSLKRMYAALGKLPAKEVIVALDSCFSGAGGRSVIAKGSRPLVMNLQTNVALPRNMTVLSASAGDQTSSTYDEKGHGLFTYFMLKGIKNEDVVKKDGSLDTASLFDYIKPQVQSVARKKYNNEQTPQLIEPRKN